MQPDRSSHLVAMQRSGGARLLIAAGLVLITVSVVSLTSTARAETAPFRPAQPLAPSFQAGPDGAALFKARCTSCHTIGGGRLVGPDLQGVAQRHTTAWLKSFIANPPAMIATDATAQALQKQFGVTMPNLSLAPAEVDALVAFLSNPGNQVIGGATAAAAVGDPAAGRRIYRGEQALTNRGPACIACHSVSGASRLNGGALGPDLTHVAGRMGQAGLTAALNSIAFPTMLGPFGDHPLTPQEVADLVAFLEQANMGQPELTGEAPGSVTVSALVVFGLGSAGALALFGLLLIFWPRQRQSLSGLLRSRAQPGSRKA